MIGWAVVALLWTLTAALVPCGVAFGLAIGRMQEQDRQREQDA